MTFLQHRFNLFMLIAIVLLPTQCLRADISVNNFDDIVNWTGSGSNRAALAIDWGDASAPLVWGFRFNGTATGEDMFKAVVTADDRLFAKVQFFNFGGPSMFVHGIGYDRNAAGFAIDSGDDFGATGLLVSGSYEDARSVDPLDSYRETGINFTPPIWSYYGANGFNYPPSWDSALLGATDRILTDLSWDGWRFDSSTAGPRAAFAAVPEPSSMAMLVLAGAGSLWWRRLKRKPIASVQQ